jgi:hypothetical protein
MMPEDDNVADGAVSDDALAALYDWFKHLTSLSLLTLGGVLTISQSAAADSIRPSMLLVVVIFVAGAGVLSFSGAATLVGVRSNNQPLPSYIHHISGIAAMALMIGVGAFTYIFVKVM